MPITVSSRLKVAAAVAILATASLAAAPTGTAEPSEDPCALAFSLFCKFVPIAPDLEHNIDLTQNQPPVDPAAPPPESFPMPDICANGCV